MVSMILHPRYLLIVSIVLALGGCASSPDNDSGTVPLPASPFSSGASAETLTQRELRLKVDELYRAARDALEASDYRTALTRYDLLISSFPFSVYSTQASLERIYALHRSFEPESALIAADRFVRDHPRHPRNDYVQYLRGLINEGRGQGFLSGLGYDATQDDVGYARRAFDDFGLLVQRYPDSPYNTDARKRMVLLRNRIAAHEMHVLRFYMDRGAFLAASRRAEHIVATYPGAPVIPEVLALMERAYRTLGLTEQAEATETLLRGNDLPTAADLGEAQVEPAWWEKLGTRVGSWFGLSGGSTEDET